MKINITDYPQNFRLFRNFLFYIAIVLNIAILIWMFIRVHYGLDLTDEGFYLNWISNPWLYKSSISQFGYIYHPLYVLVNGDIATLRFINVLLTYGISLVLIITLFNKIPSKNQSHSVILRIIFSAQFATASLVYFYIPHWLTTPSYNSLTLQALLITSIGTILTAEDKSILRILGYVIIGFGGWLCFMAKPTSAICLAAIILMYLLLAKKFNLKLLSISFMVVIILFLFIAWYIDGSMSEFIYRYITGLENSKLLVPLGTNLLRLEDIPWSFSEKIFFFLNIILISMLVYLNICTSKLKNLIGLSCLLFLILIGFLIVFNVLHIFLDNYDFLAIQICAISGSAVAMAIFLLKGSFFNKITRVDFAFVAYFIFLPYAMAFGTSNNYWIQSQLAYVFFLLSGLIFLLPTIHNELSWKQLMPLAIVIEVFVVILLQSSMDSPYRQQQSIYQMDRKISVGSSRSQLFLSEELANMFKNMQEKIIAMGFNTGIPMIDLSGRSPGILYIIGAKAIASAWMMGGYSGSDAAAQDYISKVGCRDLAESWLLIDPESPRKLSFGILSQFQINSEKNYKFAGEFRLSSEKRKVQLWKPIRALDAAINECKAIRKNRIKT